MGKNLAAIFLLFLIAGKAGAVKSITFGFTENRGQVKDQSGKINKDVLYICNNGNMQLQLRKNGFSYQLSSSQNENNFNPAKVLFSSSLAEKSTIFNTHRVDFDFAGNGAPFVMATKPLTTYDNYYLADLELAEVKSFERITYKNAFPGTDVEFIITNNSDYSFKYNIVLHPGAKLEDVKFILKGASQIQLLNPQTLKIQTSLGALQENIPSSYYSDSETSSVYVNYQITDHTISFKANYNTNKTLVIDPVSNLIWATYYGGSGIEFCHGADTDSQDNLYFCGYSNSTSNIATSGAFQATLSAMFDAYLVKLNSTGVRQWATYLGGAAGDIFYAIHAKNNSGIYVCGSTNSTLGITSPGAHQTSFGGGVDDVILAKFNSNGQRVWCTYFGGPKHDIAQAITVDTQSNVIITGHTESQSGIATLAAFNGTYNFNYDVFAAKFSQGGSQIWGTYFGDSDVDEAFGIAHDPSNNIIITGVTRSLAGIVSGQAHQSNPGGAQDAFIAKINPGGTALIWSTFFGGSSDDFGVDAEVDKDGKIIVCGVTTSSNNIVTVGAAQGIQGSYDDSFLACFSPAGARLWATYFGGEDSDYINDIEIDNQQNIILSGATLSSFSISTTGAFQPTISTPFSYDSFICKYSNSGNKLLGTYFGSSGNEFAKGMAIDGLGKIYIAGETNSASGLATTGAHSTIYSGSNDAFVAKFCIPFAPTISPAGTKSVCTGNQTLTAPSGYSTYVWNNSFSVNPLIVSSTTVAGTYSFVLETNDGYGCTGISDTTFFMVSTCLGIQESNTETIISTFPNPVANTLHIQINQNPESVSVLTIFNLQGKKLTENTYQPAVDVSTLPPGLYLLKVKINNQEFCRKFIKE